MSKELSITLKKAVYRILKPMIRLLLRYNMPYTEFEDIAKRAYVDIVSEDLKIPGKKLSTSRIAVVTGMSRKEVTKVRGQESHEFLSQRGEDNRAIKVIREWIRQPDYQDETGSPLALPFNGDNKSFTSLVKMVSGDVPVKAIFDELSRIGSVREFDQKIELTARALIPHNDDGAKIKVAARAASDLLHSLNHNLSNPDTPWLQRTMRYSQLPQSAMADLKKWASENGQLFLEKSDNQFEAIEKEHSKLESSQAYQAGIGIYYFQHLNNPSDSGDKK